MLTHAAKLSRRAMLELSAGSILASLFGCSAGAASPEIKLPEGPPTEKWDFGGKSIEGWTTVSGQWSVEDAADAPSGSRRALVQRAVGNEFNVIVCPLGPYTDVDVSMKFKPISGQEDASGGIVFRFSDGKYYVIRANALEDNFRFYYYDGGRRMLSSAGVRAPDLGKWHTVRAVVVGERVQGWLDGTRLLDHRDQRFKAGRVGLWTKADSVTAFDDLSIRGISAGT